MTQLNNKTNPPLGENQAQPQGCPPNFSAYPNGGSFFLRAEAMGKDPAFLFYPNDYLGGTMGMSYEQKGAYMDLLIMQWSIGRFTEQHAQNQMGSQFEKLWPQIKHKFETDGNLFWKQRLEDEINKRSNYTESRRKNASYKKESFIDTNEHMLQHMGNRNRNRNIDENADETCIPEKKVQYRDYVKMTEVEFKKLVDKYGHAQTERMLDTLDAYKGSTGRKYKDDYRAVLSWVAEKVLSSKIKDTWDMDTWVPPEERVNHE